MFCDSDDLVLATACDIERARGPEESQTPGRVVFYRVLRAVKGHPFLLEKVEKKC